MKSYQYYLVISAVLGFILKYIAIKLFHNILIIFILQSFEAIILAILLFLRTKSPAKFEIKKINKKKITEVEAAKKLEYFRKLNKIS